MTTIPGLVNSFVRNSVEEAVSGNAHKVVKGLADRGKHTDEHKIITIYVTRMGCFTELRASLSFYTCVRLDGRRGPRDVVRTYLGEIPSATPARAAVGISAIRFCTL